ncbi:hypothetical protein IFM89_032204 [Coptis chinensis]|uniref:Myb/SANT-like domain-containing protein n=1 Tax=Coptis chinensis TaxID=261450 RepID=A0A835LT16_9MAGN|nr:hypothetical protein IFM89_032204 [Coptis chinensis]
MQSILQQFYWLWGNYYLNAGFGGFKALANSTTAAVNTLSEGDNVRSRLKTMRLAWQVAKHAVDVSGFGLSFNKETKRIDVDENAWESYVKAHPLANTLRQKSFPYYDKCCLIFGNDYATGEGGNSGFDDDMVDGDTSRDTSQTESGPRSTTPTSKKTRKSRFFEDIPEPPSFKVLTEAVAKIAEALKPEPQEEEVDQIDLLKDALQSLPDMNPELFLRSLDLLVENDRLIKVFLGLKEDIKASWLFRRLEQNLGVDSTLFLVFFYV